MFDASVVSDEKPDSPQAELPDRNLLEIQRRCQSPARNNIVPSPVRLKVNVIATSDDLKDGVSTCYSLATVPSEFMIPLFHPDCDRLVFEMVQFHLESIRQRVLAMDVLVA